MVATVVTMVLASIVHAETDVIYQDMIDAYQAGELDLARNLADKYLDMFANELTFDHGDVDRAGSLIRLLGTIKSMLRYENNLDAADRLAADKEFIDKVKQQLYSCRDSYASLSDNPANQKAFIQHEVGYSAGQFIKAMEVQSSRSELDRIFSDFGPELQTSGKSSVDALLQASAQIIDEEAPRYTLEPDEAKAIVAAAREYFAALVAKDGARLASVCGKQVKSGSGLIARFDEDCREAGVESIASAVISDPSESTLIATFVDRKAGLFSVSLRGIELQVIETNGKSAVRTINKHLRLQRDGADSWIVLVPND